MTKWLMVVLGTGSLMGCGFEPLDPGARDGASIEEHTGAISVGSLSLGPIFGHHMVLQRDTTVPVFGTAQPGASVAVTFAGQTVATVAGGTGAWQVELAPLAAGGAPTDMTVSSGPDTVTLTDVEVGELWVCSGQSNMGRSLSSADGSAPYIAAAPNHDLRLFRMHNSSLPATTTWQLPNATTAAAFSAVCYWMGLDLSEDLGVPVGLVQASFDGSAIEEWTHASGGTAEHYENMIAPLQPFKVKGVLWYQGESNGGEASYGAKLQAMIAEWRGDWGQPVLPFGIVQLPAAKWKAARLGQFEVTQTVSDTFLVVTHDLPGGNQLHPTAKYPVGIRSSVGARGAVYGEPIVYSGPLPAATSSVVGSTAVIDFAFAGNGLTTTPSGAPGPFQIAGSDGRFQTGTATIVGSTVRVSSNRVQTPVSVRYGTTALGNLFNSVQIPIEGPNQLTALPASLFEIDL